MSSPRLFSHDSESVEHYRPLSRWAALGLLLAIVSPLAFLLPIFWGLPVAAMVASAIALMRLRGDDTVGGRNLAWAGLGLGLCLLVASVTNWYVYRHFMEVEARQVARGWFQFLANDQPQRAFTLHVPAQSRPPLAGPAGGDDDAALWEFFRAGPKWRRQLEEFVAYPTVRTLVALGDQATVRWYASEGFAASSVGESTIQVFAVTHDDELGQRKTFFVRLILAHEGLPDGQLVWRIISATGGIRPKSLPEPAAATP